jgi:hypothetical protein
VEAFALEPFRRVVRPALRGWLVRAHDAAAARAAAAAAEGPAAAAVEGPDAAAAEARFGSPRPRRCAHGRGPACPVCAAGRAWRRPGRIVAAYGRRLVGAGRLDEAADLLRLLRRWRPPRRPGRGGPKETAADAGLCLRDAAEAAAAEAGRSALVTACGSVQAAVRAAHGGATIE